MSLTSITCEIFKIFLKKAFLPILGNTWAISANQHGFLPQQSCLFNRSVFDEVVVRFMDECLLINIVDFVVAKAFNQRTTDFRLRTWGPTVQVIRLVGELKHNLLDGSQQHRPV